MAETDMDEEVFELEFSEDDIAYYIVDEDGNEVGIALYDEDGNEVEFYYAESGVEYVAADDLDEGDVVFVTVDDDAAESDADEVFELEFSEDDVAYYIVDENGNEIGFALEEPDGAATEYYYEGVNADDYVTAPADIAAAVAAAAGATVAGATGAGEAKPEDIGKNAQPFARRAGEEVGKLATKASAGAAQAAAAAKSTARKIKDGATAKPKEDEDEDLGFGLTSGQVKKAAGDFNSLAKEGAQAAAELRGVYDDIFSGLDFLKPSASSRTTRRR